MTTEQRLVELWTRPPDRHPDPVAAFRDLYTDPVSINDVPTPVVDLLDRVRTLHTAFDQHMIEIVDRIAAPGKLAIAFRHHARHIGPWHTPLGELAPTGHTITGLGVDLLTITGQRISRIWVLADELQRLIQINPHLSPNQPPAPQPTTGQPAPEPADRVLLHTPRLVVRRFHPGDTTAFAAYRSDPEIARYQSWTTPLFPATAAELVDTFAAADPHTPGWCQYAIELRSTHTLIGDIGVNLHDNQKQAEIGFTLVTAHQGNGYATEALRGVLEHLFTHRRLHRVSAECDARNHRSARLLHRLGFHQEGHRRAHTWIKDEWTDDLLFGLLADDWRHSTL